MIEHLQELVNGNPALVHRGRWTNADMLLEVGDRGHVVAIRQGRIEAVRPVEMNVSKWHFAIRASTEAWAEFWQPMPKPRHHDLIALIREGKMRFEGDLDLLMANLLYLKLVLEAPRKLEGTA
ncbi:MAG: hypothetical protein OEN23_01420 [Paracoccaceae bacterium]|nr:hypothetical protein [Paracoccaceae bacterium]